VLVEAATLEFLLVFLMLKTLTKVAGFV